MRSVHTFSCVHRTLALGWDLASSHTRQERPSWYPKCEESLLKSLADARAYSLAEIGQRPRRPVLWRRTEQHVLWRVNDHLGNIKIVAGRMGKVEVYYGGAPEEGKPKPDGDGHGHIWTIPKGTVWYSRPPGAPHGIKNCHKRNRR